jgi:5-methylcytosine-specific restriction endonuclease McrA
MPIKPENRALYGKDWPRLSQLVRAEAGQRCERCKAPNGKTIARGGWSDAGTYMLEDGEVVDENDGTHRGVARGSEYEAKRFVRVVLTVAHLNQDPRDNRRENLQALCQQCHLRLDAKQHAENARRTRASKRGQASLPFDAPKLT